MVLYLDFQRFGPSAQGGTALLAAAVIPPRMGNRALWHGNVAMLHRRLT